MKSILLLAACVLVGSALSSTTNLNAHNIQDLAARAIDPKTMDPTKLSILFVLKTAAPAGLDPRPTGGAEPEWYAKLPADIKRLLPALYPAAVGSSAAVMSARTTAVASTTAHAAVAPSASGGALDQGEVTSHVTRTSTLTLYVTSKVAANKTLSHAPGQTAAPATSANSTAVSTPATNRTASPPPEQTVSVGVKNAVSMETLALVAWGVVGAGFFLLA